MKCPTCQTDNVRPAKEKSLDLLAALIRRSAWRCRGCGARFYAVNNRTLTTTRKQHGKSLFRNPSPRVRQLAKEMAILLVAVLLFFVFIKYLSTEHSGSNALFLNLWGRDSAV